MFIYNLFPAWLYPGWDRTCWISPKKYGGRKTTVSNNNTNYGNTDKRVDGNNEISNNTEIKTSERNDHIRKDKVNIHEMKDMVNFLWQELAKIKDIMENMKE